MSEFDRDVVIIGSGFAGLAAAAEAAGAGAKVVILENNFKRHIFCYEFHIFYFPGNFYNITTVDFFIFIKAYSITSDFFFFDHFLKIAS